MLTLSGCKFELEICPAIYLDSKQIFGTLDYALSMIHFTGTHTDPAYVIHLKYNTRISASAFEVGCFCDRPTEFGSLHILSNLATVLFA